MAYTAINFVQSALGKLIHQVAHNFYVGCVVTLTGATYVRAQADAEIDAQSVGIVSQVIGADDFVMTQAGFVYNIASPPNPLTAGDLYYLSDATAGLLTTTPGAVVLPLFYADSPDSGYFFNNYPIGTGTGGLTWSTVSANTPMLPSRGYIINGVGPIDMTLPVNFAIGDTITILGAAGNGWNIKQNGSQSIIVNATSTTVGAGGEIDSTANWNCITIEGVVANTTFQATNIVGTPNVI